jgi:ABC-type glycerol-3-phosphate transport system permease component
MGIPTMMFVAALRNISDDYFEAASIDGANPVQVFWHIKLPLIKPVLGMIAILTFVNNFNAFDVVLPRRMSMARRIMPRTLSAPCSTVSASPDTIRWEFPIRAWEPPLRLSFWLFATV